MSRKVIYQCAVSLDGFIEDHEGKFDWCLTDFDFDMEGFLDAIDTILYGRTTYEVVLQMGESFDGTKKHCIFASHLPVVAAYCEWIQDDAGVFVDQLRKESGKDIWLFGGALLAGSLAEAGLVDELQLAVHPLALGRGTPLFKNLKRRLPYMPVDSKIYGNGVVMMTYQLNL
jgi:dihydrofolate reductase